MKIKSQETLALDSAAVSQRFKDRDGRLHVRMTPISKANVCPYYGREINNWQSLKLNPDKIYNLYRHPDELKKAAHTFNNIQLLTKHKAINAEQPAHDMVIGSLGTDANFDGTYLNNSLVVWDQNAIDDIESNQRKELSSSYYYEAKMTPGVINGVAYDGIMINITANHTALVPEGRVGRDVAVSDEMPIDLKRNRVKLETVDMPPTLKQMRDNIIKIKPLLANDATLDDLISLLSPADKEDSDNDGIIDALDPDPDVPATGSEAPSDSADNPEDAPVDDPVDGDPTDKTDDVVDQLDPKEENPADPNDPVEKIFDFLSTKLSPEDLAALRDLVQGQSADKPVEKQIAADTDKEGITDVAPNNGIDTKGKKLPAGNDAAPKLTAKQIEDKIMLQMRARSDAAKVVKPFVGEIDILSYDSAEGIYAGALKGLGINVDGVHPSAYRAILENIPSPASRVHRNAPQVAMDEAQRTTFETRFPNFGRLKTVV